MTNEDWIKKLEEEPGFFKNNKYHVLLENDEIMLKADLDENSMNPYGFAHGGLIFGLGDTMMGILAAKNGRTAVTINATINYISKGIGKYLIAKANVIKEGKTTCFLECHIYDENEKLVATLQSNYYYLN